MLNNPATMGNISDHRKGKQNGNDAKRKTEETRGFKPKKVGKKVAFIECR